MESIRSKRELAAVMCERWGLDRVRFTNSGTEANLMAITAARMHTGRSAVMVMHGGYHGGVLYFGSGVAPGTRRTRSCSASSMTSTSANG